MAKTKIETGVSILTKEQAVKLFPSIMKDEIASFVKRFDGIVITNQEELGTTRIALTHLNKVINKVETARKEKGNPYKDAKALVDLVAKEIIGNAPAVIEDVKAKIAEFEDAEEKKRVAAAKAAEDEQRGKLKEIEATKNKRLSIIADIKEAASAAADRLQACKNFDELKPAFQLHVVDQFNDIIKKAEDDEIRTFATEAKNKLIALKNTIKDSMGKGTVSQAASIVNDLQQIANDAVENVVEDAQSKKAGSMINTQAAIMEAGTGGINSDRFSWQFKVVDFSKVDDAWKTVDVDAVKEYINLNKEKLEDGQIINGIQFTRKRSVVLA